MENLKPTVTIETGTSWETTGTVEAGWDEPIELVEGVSFVPGKELNIKWEIEEATPKEKRDSLKSHILSAYYERAVKDEAAAAKAVISAIYQWEVKAKNTAKWKFSIEKRANEIQEGKSE